MRGKRNSTFKKSRQSHQTGNRHTPEKQHVQKDTRTHDKSQVKKERTMSASAVAMMERAKL
jgi:hypothetical protein